MLDFLKKMSEWALKKEEEVAQKCLLKPEDIQKQIEKTQEKKEELEKRCKENLEELESLLQRLEKIKEYAQSCKVDKKD
jgi:soluble cytochrome b562